MPVNANAGEYKSRVGLDSLYIAEVTQDDASAYVADTPEYLAPAAEATQEPTVNSETQFADDQPYDVIVEEGETVVTLTITGLPPEMQAKLLGKEFDSTTGRVYDNGGTPPDMALGFRSRKSNGSYKYFWFLKGKFMAPSEKSATRGDTPDPKTTEIVYTAIRSTFKFDVGSFNDAVKRVYGDSDTTNFSATGWFNSVQTPASSVPSSLALSASDPADGAAGVVITKTIALTFNNALRNNAIYNVVVVKADGTAVACTNSLDATKKIMTVNPDASLDGASTYIVAYGVEDIYGDTLNGAINFGTA